MENISLDSTGDRASYSTPSTAFRAVSENIKIKEIQCSTEGIRLKYERFHRGQLEECQYPKRGEPADNYSDEIDELLSAIALLLLEICGLEPGVWNNDTLRLHKICFLAVEDDNGLSKLAISGGISSRNELLMATQKFSIPKIPYDVLLESGLKVECDRLISEAIAFYNGKTKYEQGALF